MTPDSISVAVIGGGMAGRAHASGYRTASTVFSTDRPRVRLVAVADAEPAVAQDVARRYGYERAEATWQAVAQAPDIDAVSVAVANPLHREIVEGLLAAGKHVLCEKPLATSPAEAEEMAAAAEASGRVAALGYTFRRSPAISAIREEVRAGNLGAVITFSGRYWCDYALDPRAPMTWRYRGGPGSGALSDVGSHLIDLAEFVCGPLSEVSGASFATLISERPIPARTTVGHHLVEVTSELAQVENDDQATFTARFASGALGTFSVSRVAHGMPDGLGFELFGTGGSAGFDLHRAGEFFVSYAGTDSTRDGRRQVIIGPAHPYIREGLPMDAGGVGYGVAELFAYQARAFLDQIAGVDGLPPCPGFRDGVHGHRVVAAVTESARSGGAAVKVD
jgi:predicted dehydrogenase